VNGPGDAAARPREMQLSKLLEEVRSKEEKLRQGEPPAGYSVFTPDLPGRIREAIKRAEGNSKARCLLPGHVDAVLEVLAARPAGEAWAHGGSPSRWRRDDIYKKTSYLWIRWFTLRNTKVVWWRAERIAVYRCPVPLAGYPDYTINTNSSTTTKIWRAFFPERDRLLHHLKLLRRLRQIGVNAPPDVTIEKIVETLPRLRLAWVESGFQRWLLTPLGAFLISRNVRSIGGAFREVTGRRLPEGRGAVWENIEPLFVMAALAK